MDFDPGEEIPHSAHPESHGDAAKSLGAMGQKISLFVAISLVAFYLLTSLWIASHRRFWYDEISTALIAGLPDLATIWKALASPADNSPPGYFVLVRLFQHTLGPLELAARIPSALALAIGLLITFDCVRRLTDNLYALASLALLSCSLLPYYGYEARPYGLYFMFAAMELWLWVHSADNRTWAVLFGVTFFLAFSVHYYSAVCLVPYAAIEASRWKPWRAPSRKLLAASLGVLCGIVLFLQPILGARAIAPGFWAAPSRGALLKIFGEFFPSGLFIAAAALILAAWTARPEKLLLDPMLTNERTGWFFLLIPFAGYVAATLVTNAYHNRYFIGMLPGVALAFACALRRHFRHRPGLWAAIVSGMLSVGLAHQVSVTAQPGAIEPQSSKGAAAKLSEALTWEAVVIKDGKKTIAVPADDGFGLEARYYSKYPERYAFVVTPRMRAVWRTNRNLSAYRPMRLWSLEDLRSGARDTALIDPTDQMLKAMTDAGFKIKQFGSEEVKVVYLE